MPIALLVSHSGQRCGVFQYGINLFSLLKDSDSIEWKYVECGSTQDLSDSVELHKPDIVIFNYVVGTMRWVTQDAIKFLSVPAVGIYHESNQALVDGERGELFDFWLCIDPTIIPRNPRVLIVPRFIIERKGSTSKNPKIFTVGSFGFATRTKGFPHLCRLVNSEFDEAVIRLNLPAHDEPQILAVTMEEIEGLCWAEVKKPDIKLEITHEFFDQDQVLAFLEGNTLNAFLYSDPAAKGISSCVDFALAVDKPLALTRSPMFRHLAHINPSIFVEDCSLRMIAESGTQRLQEVKKAYSAENARKLWNEAVLSIVQMKETVKSVPDGRGFNKILDDRSREAYTQSLSDLARLAPDMIARKIARANIQQAFAFDTALRYLQTIENPKILAAGSYEDTTIEALRQLGYAIDEIDPNINGLTLLDYYLQSPDKLAMYDVVLSVSVLEHVEDDEQFVQIATEFLKPHGVAILTVDFKETWAPGVHKPIVDHRLYTTDRILNVLLPAAGNCALVDVPTWAEGHEDFEYEGSQYGFAGLVLKKLDRPDVGIKPVWMNLVGEPAPKKKKDLMTSIRALISTERVHRLKSR